VVLSFSLTFSFYHFVLSFYPKHLQGDGQGR